MRFIKLLMLLLMLSCSNKSSILDEKVESISVENIILLNEKICLENNKYCNYFYIELSKTNLDWINKLLEERVFKNRIGSMEEQAKNFILGSKNLLQNAAKTKKDKFIDWSFMHSQVFLNQRNNLLQFAEEVNIYTGEDEPTYGTYYFVIDLERQKILSLADILVADKSLLVQKLKEKYPALEEKNSDEIFNLDNFRFETNDLVFLFNANELSTELTELKIPYLELEEIVNKEFLINNLQIEFPKK